MGRNRRIQVADVVYHVTARGNLRRDIFLDDDDRHAFLGVLADACDRDGLRCHAYCLMDNHYHLLLETPRANIATAMHRINCLHANRFNRVHGLEGHVFERPYRAWVMRGGRREMEAARYIARNPIRAGLCATAEAWPWSSYPATVGLAPRSGFVSVARVQSWFGSDDDEALSRYRAFVESGVDQPQTRPSLDRLLPRGRHPDLAAARAAGYTLTEIGLRLGLSPATVSRRLAVHGTTGP
jgi:putative transposase